MAEHELNKIVDDVGEVFNLRDSTKQPVADRVKSWSSTPSDTKYPSEKLVKTSLDGKVSKTGDTMTGTLAFQKTLRQVITGTGTAASSSSGTYYPAKWNFDLGVATPTAGDQMVIKLPVAGSDYGVYISTDNGTTYFPVARHTGASRLTTQYPSGAYICVVFEDYVSGSSGSGQVNDIFPLAGGTARTSLTTGCWRVINDYDSGNTICQIRTENGRFYAGSTGCNPYALVCLDKAGKYSMLVSSGSGTGTSKTINTAGKFKLDPVILYYSANNTTAANALVSSTYATFVAHQSVDTRYSHNYTTAFTTNSPLYIECTIDADGYWSPTTQCITQTLTAGNYYIYLGQTYSTAYQVSLSPAHPVYYYDGTDLINYAYGTFMKPVSGTTTLVSNTAVKVGTVNGEDVNLKLPTIPAAANNGALKIGLNGGTATSKFTANQSGDSTLTFASGTAVGTIKVDGTDVAVAGAQTGLVDFYDVTVTSSTNTVSGETYNAIVASITAGRMVFLRNGGNPLYRYLDTTSDKLWFYSPFEELAINKAANNDATHTFTVEPKSDSFLSGSSQNSVQNNVIKAALDSKADASVVTALSSNVATHSTLFHSEVLNVTDGDARFLKISFSGRVGRCIALIIISDGASDSTSAAFRLSWEYISSTPNGITGIGKEIFSCSDLAKPPLVYKDRDNFYIGVYTSHNRSATISVMMTSEDPSKVSFSTVTRAVATANTAVPLTWHAVMSETVNEIVVGSVGVDSKTLYII